MCMPGSPHRKKLNQESKHIKDETLEDMGGMEGVFAELQHGHRSFADELYHSFQGSGALAAASTAYGAAAPSVLNPQELAVRALQSDPSRTVAEAKPLPIGDEVRTKPSAKGGKRKGGADLGSKINLSERAFSKSFSRLEAAMQEQLVKAESDETLAGVDHGKDKKFIEELTNRCRVARWVLGKSAHAKDARGDLMASKEKLLSPFAFPPVGDVENLAKKSDVEASIVDLANVLDEDEFVKKCNIVHAQLDVWTVLTKAVGKASSDVRLCVNQRQKDKDRERKRKEKEESVRQKRAEKAAEREADKKATDNAFAAAAAATAQLQEPEIFKKAFTAGDSVGVQTFEDLESFAAVQTASLYDEPYIIRGAMSAWAWGLGFKPVLGRLKRACKASYSFFVSSSTELRRKTLLSQAP